MKKKKASLKRKDKNFKLLPIIIAVVCLLIALFILKKFMFVPKVQQESKFESLSSETLGVTSVREDKIAPVVTITSPAQERSTIKRYGLLTLAANAYDNVRVQKVEFFVNKELMCVDISRTYGCSMRISGRKGIQYIVDAVATDTSGNMATDSATVVSQ